MSHENRAFAEADRGSDWGGANFKATPDQFSVPMKAFFTRKGLWQLF